MQRVKCEQTAKGDGEKLSYRVKSPSGEGIKACCLLYGYDLTKLTAKYAKAI